MNLPENDYQILQLTTKFYQNFPDPPYHEILQKQTRAYNCLLFQSHYGYFICIPYRSEISHPYSFRFKHTVRSGKHKSGLDYTKIVIINDTSYLSSQNALIDKDEFNATMIHLEQIKQEALSFIEDYVNHINGIKPLHTQEFLRRYRFSPLQYFHKELGLIH